MIRNEICPHSVISPLLSSYYTFSNTYIVRGDGIVREMAGHKWLRFRRDGISLYIRWKSTCYVYMYDWERIGWVLQLRSDKSVIAHRSITVNHWIQIHWYMDTLILEFSAVNAITFVGTKYSKFGTTYPTGWKYTQNLIKHPGSDWSNSQN